MDFFPHRLHRCVSGPCSHHFELSFQAFLLFLGGIDSALDFLLVVPANLILFKHVAAALVLHSPHLLTISLGFSSWCYQRPSSFFDIINDPLPLLFWSVKVPSQLCAQVSACLMMYIPPTLPPSHLCSPAPTQK